MNRLQRQLLPLIFTLGAFSFIAFGANSTVSLRPKVQIQGDVVYLRDVADIGGEADIVNKLGAISLGYSPALGMVRELRTEEIRRALSSGGFGDGKTVLAGSGSVQIERASQTVPSNAIKESIIAEISRYVESPTFLDLDVPDKIIVPLGPVQIRVSISSAINIFQPFSAAVDIAVDNRPFRRFSVRVAIEAFGEVYVAARDLKAGSRISRTDVRLEKRLIKFPIDRYLIPLDSLSGIVLTKNVADGQEIPSDSFVSGIVVRSGDTVKIIARSGAIQITISGQARSSGKVGERISVKNLQSGAIIQATVVDEGVVVIRF